MFFSFLEQIDNTVWSCIAPVLVIGFGIFASIRLRFPWIRNFGRMFSHMYSQTEGDGTSPFATLCVALGGQVGTGNVVGVATCIASGGPGALFWMWVTALLGMTTSFVETTLAQMYKQRNTDGTYRGGGIYYISNGLRVRWLAILMAVAVALGSGMADCMSHVNGIYESLNSVFHCNPWIVGALLSLSAGAIIYGGFRRAAAFSEMIVPFMAVAYILVSLFIIISNLPLLPKVFATIFRSAFHIRAVGGGVLGYSVMQAFRYGMSRGIFSNEAGMGTTSTISASGSPKHPATQGVLGMCGVFVDTMLICTATGIIILLSGVYDNGESGSFLVQNAFSIFAGSAAPVFIAVTLFFFGFTSLIASFYCGRVAIQYLFGDNRRALIAYLCIEMFVSMLGAVTSPDNVFLVIDLTTGLMIIPSIIALFCLFPKARACIADYDRQIHNGKKDPVFDWNAFREENDIGG